MIRPALLLCVLLSGCTGDTVYPLCQREVSSKLSSPGSAVFPEKGDPDLTISIYDTGAAVVGYVDSQNALGALVRSDFTCILDRKGRDWEASTVSVNPQP